MDAIRLDHVALGLPRAQDALELFEERLGGVAAGGSDAEPFGFRQWEFAGGGRIEVIYPSGAHGGFMQRFLANGGPRIHHVTLKVPSLDEMLARAEQHGYSVTGVNRSDPRWQEAFLHPKQAQGIVVQMVEQQRPDAEDLLPVAKPRADAARIGRLRPCAQSAEGARRQWGELLGGSGFIQGDGLVFRWHESPIVILVDVRPDAEEGPVSIELRAPRDLELPASPHPGPGARFVQLP